MFPLLAAKLWKPVAIALLIAAALGYRALLLHQRDAARAAASASERLAGRRRGEQCGAAERDRDAELGGGATARGARTRRAGGDGARARGDGVGNGGDAHGGERRTGA